MKLNFLTCVLILFSCNSFGQEQKLKLKKNKTLITEEIYSIDKKTKRRNGNYIKIEKRLSDTLVLGQYRDDIRVGVWEFKGKSNEPYLKYNYDTKEIKQINVSVDSFPIRKDSVFVIDKVDVPPLYLNCKYDIEYILAENDLAFTISRKEIYGTSLLSFVIGKDGIMKEVEVVKSLDKSLDKDMIKAVKSIDGEWLPARKNGQEIDSKVYIYFIVSEFPPETRKFEKPYCHVIGYYIQKSVTVTM